jgi:hypothetical protein
MGFMMKLRNTAILDLEILEPSSLVDRDATVLRLPGAVRTRGDAVLTADLFAGLPDSCSCRTRMIFSSL